MTTRRHVLELLGATAVAGIAVGCGPNAAADLPDPIAAWRNPGAGERDPRRYALAHAILAPNPHNRQPWLVDLPGAEEIVLYFDGARRLPATDPFDRQLTIGCGAFLELLSLAAGAQGLAAQVTAFPEGYDPQALDGRPVAHVRLAPGGAKDPLFDHILTRRTNRLTFDRKRPLSAQTAAAIAAGGAHDGIAGYGAVAGEAACEAARSTMKSAFRREYQTPAALDESVELMRFGKAEIARWRDGISLDFPGLGAMRAVGLLTREKMRTPGATAYQQGLANYDPLAESAAGFVWLVSAQADRPHEIASGRAYARMNLTATSLGVGMHPASQALQEYPEMAQEKAAIEQALAIAAPARLQMLARIGYARFPAPAPRRGLTEHLRS